jgi:hypothetical protein
MSGRNIVPRKECEDWILGPVGVGPHPPLEHREKYFYFSSQRIPEHSDVQRLLTFSRNFRAG